MTINTFKSRLIIGTFVSTIGLPLLIALIVFAVFQLGRFSAEQQIIFAYITVGFGVIFQFAGLVHIVAEVFAILVRYEQLIPMQMLESRSHQFAFLCRRYFKLKTIVIGSITLPVWLWMILVSGYQHVAEFMLGIPFALIAVSLLWSATSAAFSVWLLRR